MNFSPKKVGGMIADKAAEIIVKAVADKLKSLSPIQSEWQYVGFNNGGVSVGTPVAHIGVGVSGGILQAKQGSSTSSFYCASVDGGAGISPAPFNVTFPIPSPDLPGAGIIFKMPAAWGTLTPNSFRGGYVLINGALQCGPTANLSFMFCGSKILPLGGVDYNFVISMITHSPVLIASYGIGGALMPDIGATASVGVAV